jgi:hypothetical protein
VGRAWGQRSRRSPSRPAGDRRVAAEDRRADGGTWRPLRPDSFDVATSPGHAVVPDRFLAERGERRLDSHEAVVVAIEDGWIVRLFHYVHDAGGFEEFSGRSDLAEA